jgi:ElaB/YqjD/DUF883 family membrane-anchored ribosome-binding protein
MSDAQWDRQVLDFLKRTGEEIKTETQKILDDIRAPENQQRVRDSLNDFGSWAKQTAEEAAGMLESALKKAEDALSRATDRVLSATRPGPEGGPTNGAPAATNRPRRAAKATKGAARRRRPAAARRSRPKRR